MLNFSNYLVCLNHTLSPSYQKPMDWSLSCIFSFDNLFLSNVLHNTEEENVLLILLSYLSFFKSFKCWQCRVTKTATRYTLHQCAGRRNGVCLSSMCLPIPALPEGSHQSVCPHPPAISLDINGQCGRGRGLPSHRKNLTHLSHWVKYRSSFMFRQCSCTSAPRTVWWQRTSKGGQRWERMVPDWC